MPTSKYRTESLAMRILKIRMMQDSKLFFAMRNNMTPFFYKDLEVRALKNKNVIISWHGLQGYGKSMGAFYVASRWSGYAKTKFIADRIAFTDDELMRMFGNQEKKTIYVKDEQIDTFGTGAVTEKAAVENVGAVARAQQLSLIYCSPDLRLHNVHYIVESTGVINEDKQIALHILYDGKTETPIGRLYTKIPDMPKAFWTKYNEAKDAFITAVRNQQPVDRTKRYQEIAEEFVKEFIEKQDMKFGSKKQLRVIMQGWKPMNFGTDEWLAVNNFVDMICKQRSLNPYTFPSW